MNDQRDTLTGEKLPPLFVAFVSSMIRASDGEPVPVSLHRHQWATDDALQWSKAFARYIGDLYPASITEEWRVWREWYRDGYIVARLAVKFGDEATKIAVALADGSYSKVPNAKHKRALRQARRAVRKSGGLNPWQDRPLIGRRDYQFAE